MIFCISSSRAENIIGHVTYSARGVVARIIRPQVVGIAASRGCRRRRHRRRRRRHWGVASRRVSRWDARRVGARARSSSNNNYIKNVCKCMKEINLDSW